MGLAEDRYFAIGVHVASILKDWRKEFGRLLPIGGCDCSMCHAQKELIIRSVYVRP